MNSIGELRARLHDRSLPIQERLSARRTLMALAL